MSAANVALLASNVSAVTKSTRFIGFSFYGLNDASVRSMHAASNAPVPADIVGSDRRRSS